LRKFNPKIALFFRKFKPNNKARPYEGKEREERISYEKSIAGTLTVFFGKLFAVELLICF
jgi:hypothetical protein